MRIQTGISKLLSIVFNPLVMPTIGIVLLLNSGTFLTYLPGHVKNFILLITGLSTLIMPASMIPFLYYRGIMKNLDIQNSKNRVLPMVFALLMYIIGYYWIYKFVPSNIIKSFWLGFTLSVLVVLIISYFWKISAHMTGIGGVLGLVFALFIRYNVEMFSVVLIAILASGLLAYARLRLNAHNIFQIFSGFLVGLIIVFITVLYY